MYVYMHICMHTQVNYIFIGGFVWNLSLKDNLYPIKSNFKL